MRLVLIEWHDANSVDGWVSDAHLENMAPTSIRSVGWIKRRTKREIVLVSHMSDDKDRGAIWTIPTGCVTKITSLKESADGR